LRKALRDFGAALVRVRGITIEIDKNASAALGKRSILARHEVMQCACAAIMSGFFEAFLRDTAEAFVADVSALRIPFKALPSAVQKAHYGKGGAVLAAKQNKQGKASWVTASPDDIARRLASVNSVPYDLLWEAFADTQSNPSFGVIGGLLSALGVDKPWAKLSLKTGVSTPAMEARLDSFLLVRNECAHTGTATTIPTPSDIRSYAGFLSTLARGVVRVLEDHLASPEFNRSLSVPLPAPSSIVWPPPAGAGAASAATTARKRIVALFHLLWERIRRALGR
jgi:hypothetical protein